jgi:hypothetical protein
MENVKHNLNDNTKIEKNEFETQRSEERPTTLRASMGYMKETQFFKTNVGAEISSERKSNDFLRGSHNTFIQSRFNHAENEEDSSDPEIDSDSDEKEERVESTILTEKYKYIGELKNGKKDGFGVCFYTNGDKYVGYWLDDAKSGFGRLTMKNGKTFSGEFSDNSIDGFVEYINNQGVVHYGIMRGYKFIPNEPLVMKNSKCRFQGKMKYNDGKLGGIGTFNYANGSKYEGEICDYSECGLGILYRHDGYIFKGENRERVFSGFCEVIHPDKSLHFGNYKNNIKEGLMISISADGVYSVGLYQDDVKNGGFLSISKESKKFEIWLFGFSVKVVEKKENIIGYVNTVYPEYKYLLKLKNTCICNVLKQ